jgi:hypothetical protein
MQRSDYAAACDAFAGSNEADPSPGTQMNLASCKEKQNNLADAWAWYTSAAELAANKGQTERADKARAEAARLDRKVGRMVIDKSVPDGANVSRDGKPVPLATLGLEIRLDPGTHVVEITALGKKPWKQSVKVAAGAVVRVDVPTLEDDPNAQRSLTPGSAPGGIAPAEGPPPPATQKTIGFILGGAGLAAMLGGGALQLFNVAVVNQDAKDINRSLSQCRQPFEDSQIVNQTTCPELKRSYDTKKSAARDNQTIALVLLGSGAALFGAGLIMVLTAPSRNSPRTQGRPQVLPLLGPDLAGASLSTAF